MPTSSFEARGRSVLRVVPSTAPQVCVVGLPPQHTQWLADAVAATLSIPCSGEEPDRAAITPDTWVLVTPSGVDRMLALVPADHCAVLWGNRPETVASRAWHTAGCTVLQGPMPGAALDWLGQRLNVQESDAEALQWDANGFDAAEALEWSTEASPVPAMVPSRPRAGLPPSSGRLAMASKGSTIAVYSCGGGVGKTTTAVYLATLAASQRIATGIVELDENRGAILASWDQPPRGGGLDSIPPADWVDPGRLADALTRYAVPINPHLTVLPIMGTLDGLQYPRDNPESAKIALQHLYAWAAQRWVLTVYDLSANIRDEAAFHTLAMADRVLFVVEPQARMLRSAMVYLDLLEQLGSDGATVLGKMGVVVNKIEKARAARLNPQDMAQSLGLPLWGEIPANGVKYNSEINQHHVVVTPEWQKLWGALNLPLIGREGAPAHPEAHKERPLWKRLIGSSRKYD